MTCSIGSRSRIAAMTSSRMRPDTREPFVVPNGGRLRGRPPGPSVGAISRARRPSSQALGDHGVCGRDHGVRSACRAVIMALSGGKRHDHEWRSRLGRVRRTAALLAIAALAASAAGCSGAGSPAAGTAPTAAPTTAATTTATAPTAAPTVTTAPASQSPAPAASPSPRRTPAAPRAERYVYPVQRCGSTYSSSHHDYPAADIFTQKGCAFVAVTSGRVDEVSFTDRWDPQVDSGASRGGRSVSVVGDDGVRYYGSHLLRIARGIQPGARVRAGQLLGLIDNSGDAKYTATHVHFGLSWPTRPGAWWGRGGGGRAPRHPPARGGVWPQRYLGAGRAARDVSPAAEVRATEHRLGRTPPCQAEC